MFLPWPRAYEAFRWPAGVRTRDFILPIPTLPYLNGTTLLGSAIAPHSKIHVVDLNVDRTIVDTPIHAED